MSTNYAGGNSIDNKRGGYQQKRGGGQQYQQRGGGGGQKYQDAQNTGQAPGQYVKKGKQQEQQLPQNDSSMGLGDDSMTAEQKFNLLLSGGSGLDALVGGGTVNQPSQMVEEVKSVPRNDIRRAYDKSQMLTRFTKGAEINLKLFDKDILTFMEVFSSESQEPEGIKSTDSQSDMNQLQSQPPRGGPPGRFQKPGWRGGPGGSKMGALEDDEDEEDPEWVDFDPKKQSSAFFGRAIQNEQELRENAKKEKERLQHWGGRRKNTEEDEFEKFIREEKEEARKRAQMDKELSNKVESLASDLEHNERNFSDIDLIYEKHAKQKKDQHTLNDEQLEDLFSSLMEEEVKKKDVPQQKKPQPQPQQQQQQVDPNIQKVQLSQNLQQQIKELTIQQKLQIQQQKIITQQKPKFTALQNVQNLFANLPVVTYEKHRIKMDEIADMEEENKGDLFKQLMASINPFSKYMIEESQQGATQEVEKPWMLEPTIFSKPPDQIQEESLKKSSSELFVIYKYFSDPLIKVKSDTYTEGEYVQIKDLFPEQNLLQTSPLNVQLATQQMMINQQQQQQQMLMGIQYPRGPMPGQMSHTPLQPTSQAFIPSSKIQHAQAPLNQQENQPPLNQTQVQLPVSEQEKSKPQQPESGSGMPDLSDMESQLKSLLGFNPR